MTGDDSPLDRGEGIAFFADSITQQGAKGAGCCRLVDGVGSGREISTGTARSGLRQHQGTPRREWCSSPRKFNAPVGDRCVTWLGGDNTLADPRTGTTEKPAASPISVCLRNPAYDYFVFYKENATSVGMDLSAMNGWQSAVAVDARRGYAQIGLGRFDPGQHTWDAPYKSDWAIAVGRFE